MATYTFKNAELQGILKVTLASKKFRIPYEGEKLQSEPTIWIVKDAGVYLCPSVPGLKYPLPKEHLCYAVGKGPNTHTGGDDYIEEIPMNDPKLIRGLQTGSDLIIKMTSKSMSMGFSIPKQKV